MSDFSLVEKFKILMNMIASSPLFLTCLIIGILLLVFLILYIKHGGLKLKLALISAITFIITTLILNYNSILLHLFNELINGIFMALYFPSFTIYTCILIVSNFFLIYSIYNKKVKNSYRIINIVSSLLLDTFLIFVIDIVNKAGITKFDSIDVYTNSNLLVLLELSSAIFVSWILLNLFLNAYHKLQKYDKEEYPNMPEIIFDN